MSDVIRITSHPTDEQIVLVHIPPSYSNSAVMGRLEAARWSPPDRAYLLAADALPGLEALARYVGAHLVDQRSAQAKTPGGVRLLPQECRHCGQPGRATHPPAYCPACGAAWDPVPPPGDVEERRRDWVRCPGCGHGQTGRFEFCARCGAALHDQPALPLDEPARDAHSDTHDAYAVSPRSHLEEPTFLADAVAGLEQLTPSVATTAPPADPA